MPIEAVFSSKPNRSNKVICPDLLDCLAKAPLSGLLCSPHQEPASLCWLQPRGKGRVGWVGRGNALLLPLHLHSLPRRCRYKEHGCFLLQTLHFTPFKKCQTDKT